MDVQTTCKWEDEICDRIQWAKGFCAKHYKAWHRKNETPQRQKTRKTDRERKRSKLNSDPQARQVVRDYNNARYHSQTSEEKAFRSLSITANRTGIPLDTLVMEYTKHNGMCDCCGRSLPDLKEKGARLNVHHVHGTRTFGGFLCTNCNIAEGHLGGSSERARLMYLFLKDQEGGGASEQDHVSGY